MRGKQDVEPIVAWEASLRAVTELLRLYGRKMEAEVGIPLTWFDVLVQLYEAPSKRLRMHDLAAAVILSPSGLTRLIDRMEKAGLVQRELSTEDRRQVLVLLTQAGRTLARRARKAHHRHIQEHFSRHLTDDEVRTLHTAFTKVRQALAASAAGKPG